MAKTAKVDELGDKIADDEEGIPATAPTVEARVKSLEKRVAELEKLCKSLRR